MEAWEGGVGVEIKNKLILFHILYNCKFVIKKKVSISGMAGV